jgi:hypothetical protein
MKLLIALLLCGLASAPAHASPELGTWQYDGFFFQGQRYPNPNPALFLTFTFLGGSSRLFWQRKGEPGFCERLAEYRIEKDTIYQKVIWVNPKNNADCTNDPDMRMGSETHVRFAIDDAYMHFYFDINGQEFIYLLKKIGCVFD